MDGKPWLLERLTQTSRKEGAEVTAEVFHVKVESPTRWVAASRLHFSYVQHLASASIRTSSSGN